MVVEDIAESDSFIGGAVKGGRTTIIRNKSQEGANPRKAKYFVCHVSPYVPRCNDQKHACCLFVQIYPKLFPSMQTIRLSHVRY